MTTIALALGLSACIVLPPAGIVALTLWVRSLRQGARLDRAVPEPVVLDEAPEPATVCAIDSAGRPYHAVPVEPCTDCGQTLPADHHMRGLCTERTA